MRFKIIDVGGTGIEITQWPNGPSKYISIEKSNQKRIQDLISGIVDSYLNLLGEDEVIILGLPGPVDKCATKVYCPPLSTSIDYGSWQSSGVVVVNDVISQLPIIIDKLDLVGSDYYSFVTVGTSFGYCSFQPLASTGLGLQHAKSLEAAHYELSDVGISRSTWEKYSDRKLSPTKVHHLFSCGGFANCHGLTVTQDAAGMIRVSKAEIHSKIDVIKSQTHITSRWLSQLYNVASQCMPDTPGARSRDVIVGGGIVSILRLLEIEYLLGSMLLVPQ